MKGITPAQPQIPPMHAWSGWHAMPHPPQFSGSDNVSTHAPPSPHMSHETQFPWMQMAWPSQGVPSGTTVNVQHPFESVDVT
jgi:hypothetical protein